MNISVPDGSGTDEIPVSNPCPRWGTEAPEDRLQFVYDDRVAWVFAAATRMCMESVRSDAVALAWAQGLDEHGVPLEAKARANQLTEMEDWLRHLVGKYRIEGRRWHYGDSSEVFGTAECFGIGSGPGVSCLISADWKRGKGKKPAAVAAIRPQVLLFGIDPGAMEIRVTHVDAIAVELHGMLQDGAVILSERWEPEVLDHISHFEVLSDRETIIRMEKGTWRPGTVRIFPIPLSRYRVHDDDPSPRRLSRVAMTPGGEVDMTFYLFSPLSIWGGNPISIEGGEPNGIWGLNPPIEFDLQLHSEPEVDAVEPDPAVAAGFTCAKPPGTGGERMLDEPEDVPVSVRKESGTAAMQTWLARLVGRYSVDGYVDLCGNGNPADQRSVTGNVDCIAAGSPPSVHCKVNVSWPPTTGKNGAPLPGGVSNIAPAQFLFSFSTHEQRNYDGTIPGTPPGGAGKRGLQFLQLDSRGIAEGASSQLVGDSFLSRENCIDIPGNCHKITRITARPDSDEISMRVDVEINRQLTLRQVFLLRRESTVRKGEQSGASSP